MKILRIAGHPIMLLCIGGLVMIEGDHFGGFYLIYLLFGLMYAAPFALAYLASIAFVVGGCNVKSTPARLVLSVIGFLLMLLSYGLFFSDGKSNNKETFQSTVPIISFYVLGILCLCFLINTIMEIGKHVHPKNDNVVSF